jgi:hypothetical protein
VKGATAEIVTPRVMLQNLPLELVSGEKRRYSKARLFADVDGDVTLISASTGGALRMAEINA